MPNLFPEDMEETIIEPGELAEDTPIGYRDGPAFDDEAGDFKRDGKGRILDATGLEAWKNWVVNCMSTQRYAYLAYDTDFGIDIAAAFRAESREATESILTREISEALLADEYGRTAYVEDIVFDWVRPDGVMVTATVHGMDDVTIDATGYITANS